MLTDTTRSPYAKVHALDGMKVKWTGGLWKERFDTCANSTVPQLKHMFDSKDISHVVENFKICAGDAQGDFDGTVFGDGDFYKWMESAIYTAYQTDNQLLKDEIEKYIDLIGRAQQPDGYLSTKQIIGERSGNGVSRMGDINDFEVYNFGHMFTAACVHKRITGKDSFLAIAARTADYLEHLYEEAERTGEVQTAVCPSHYMGLVEMYRTTGEERYLKLAKQAIALRDSVKNGLDDNQDKIPLKQHEKILGHAVRANYLYAGVADLCLEEEDSDYIKVLHKVWRSLVDKKLYITGGCGALYNGASPYGYFFDHQLVHQAYGYEYQLPNVTAYNETCASLGGVFWAWRMFCIDPKAEYMDMLERMMLNVNLAGISMDGKRFFYENMLRRAKELPYELVWGQERTEYILSYCCPPNLARTIAESAEYAYAVDKDGVWTGLYGANKAHFKLENGANFTLVQKTQYPSNGTIAFEVEESNEIPFLLHLRIPSWATAGVLVNGNNAIRLTKKHAGTYQTIEVTDPKNACICLKLEMKPRLTRGHGLIEEDRNQVAVEYGPFVYCMESPDVDVEYLEDLLMPLDPGFKPVEYEIEGRKIQALEGTMLQICHQPESFERDALYQQLEPENVKAVPVRMIPYYAWDNRGRGEMMIWMPLAWRTVKE